MADDLGVTGVERQVVQLVVECAAMVRWAADRGQTPAPRTVETTMWATEEIERRRGFRVEGGRPEPDDRLRLLGFAELAGPLTAAHRDLSALVHPARPQTIVRMAQEREWHPGLFLLGPLPIVRRLVAVALLFLVLFIVFAASPQVRTSTAGSTPTSTASTTTSGPPTGEGS